MSDTQIVLPTDERVTKGLATIAGYGATLAGAVGFVLSLTPVLHLSSSVQVGLLIASSVLGSVTTKGRQDQAAANRQATATVAAAALTPVDPSTVAALPAPDGVDPVVEEA